MTSRSAQRIGGVAYFFGGLLVLFPLIDWLTNVWPVHPGAFQWRYGSVALLSSFLLTPMIGILALVAVAVWLGHRRWGRTVAVLSGLAGVLLVVLTIGFVLDTLQMRPTVPPASRPTFDMGSLRALAKNVLMGLGLLWLAWVGWQETRPRPAAKPAPEEALVANAR